MSAPGAAFADAVMTLAREHKVDGFVLLTRQGQDAIVSGLAADGATQEQVKHLATLHLAMQGLVTVRALHAALTAGDVTHEEPGLCEAAGSALAQVFGAMDVPGFVTVTQVGDLPIVAFAALEGSENLYARLHRTITDACRSTLKYAMPPAQVAGSDEAKRAMN